MNKLSIVNSMLCIYFLIICIDTYSSNENPEYSTVFNEIILKNKTFFSYLNLPSSLLIRLINVSFYNALNNYCKHTETQLHNNYKDKEYSIKDEQYSIAKCLDQFSMYSFSGNTIYMPIEKDNSIVQNSIPIDNTAQVDTIQPLQRCNVLYKTNIITILGYMSDYTRYLYNKYATEPSYSLVVCIARPYGVFFLKKPIGILHTLQVDLNRIYIKSHRRLHDDTAAPHALIDRPSEYYSLQSPWNIRIEPKSRELHLYSWYIDKKKIVPVLIDIFKPASLCKNVSEQKYAKKGTSHHKKYVSFFDAIIEHQTTLNDITPYDKKLVTIFNLAHKKAKIIHKEDYTTLAEYAVILKRLTQAAYDNARWFKPDEIISFLNHMHTTILSALIPKIQSKKQTSAVMSIDASGLITIPIPESGDALFEYETHSFYRVECTPMHEGGLKTINSMWDKVYCSKENRTISDESMQDTLIQFLGTIAKKYTDTMWDNGTIGATWHFERHGMSVSLYNFNAADMLINTYILPSLATGQITNIIYTNNDYIQFIVNTVGEENREFIYNKSN